MIVASYSLQLISALNGEPVFSREIGATTFRYGYDVHGNSTETRFFGVDGRPILAIGGFGTSRSTYDESGRLIDVRMFGVDGKPTATFEGVSRCTISYD